MAQRKGPMPGVYISHGRYYRSIRVDGKQRWIPLTREADGLPALLRAMADLAEAPARPADTVAALVEAWEREHLARYAAQTQADARRANMLIVAAMGRLRALEVSTPLVVQYLRAWVDKPRSYNANRAQLRELMRHAELLGWRPPGSNPTAAVRTMRTPARTRYITDSELRRIKVHAMRGDDGRDTDSGPMLCAVVDLLYLTGQAIGDVLALDVADVAGPVIAVARSKVAHSTQAAIRVRVSPRLRAVIDRLLAIRDEVAADLLQRRGRPQLGAALIVTREGERAQYMGVRAAWSRACRRAGVADARLHDLKAKALTDVERQRGMRAARQLGQHATEAQTASYVRARAAEVVDPTR